MADIIILADVRKARDLARAANESIWQPELLMIEMALLWFKLGAEIADAIRKRAMIADVIERMRP